MPAPDLLAVDPERRTARIGRTDRWVDVLARAAPFGLAPLAGVRAAGEVIASVRGDGLSYLGRRYGLVADDVLGAGTDGAAALELALHPVPQLMAGQLRFPLEQAAEVVRAWAAWAPEASEQLTTALRLVPLGRGWIVVEGVHVGPPESCAPALAPLRALGASHDTWATAVPRGLCRGDDDPRRAGDGSRLEGLHAADVEALLAGGRLLEAMRTDDAELWQLGGAMARPRAGVARRAIAHAFGLVR